MVKHTQVIGKKYINMKLPFKENKLKNTFIRTFDQNIDEGELVWHRDREDRIVKPLTETDWMVQIDNELPKPLTEEVFIPKGVYHRVIKGSGDLKIELTKLEESDFDWVDEIPSDYSYSVYEFLKDNFKVIERTIDLGDQSIDIKTLYGLDESYNLTFDSKKRIFNKICNLIEDDFLDVDNTVLRKTVRLFLNELYN
jgi:hypothetical protein